MYTVSIRGDVTAMKSLNGEGNTSVREQLSIKEQMLF